MKKSGAIFTFSHIIILAICMILLFAGVSAGYYIVNGWRANAVRAQADEIDKALVEYSKTHKGIQDKGIHYDSFKSKVVYTKKQDYPLYLDDLGQIEEKSSGTSAKENVGLINSNVEFCKNGEDPRANLYKFKYTPLDINGKEITVSSSEPVTYYNLEVFYKNEKGDIIRYVSPGSYEKIKDNEKKL